MSKSSTGTTVKGPIDYVLIEFPGSKFNGAIAPALADLVNNGTIRILDLIVIKKEEDGLVVALELSELDDAEAGDLGSIGNGSGLLTDDDIQAAGEALEPGTSAGLLLWENTWAVPFVEAVSDSGGMLVASGRISAVDLMDAMESVSA